MAQSPDGKTLYPLLEGPLTGEAFLRVLEFDVFKEAFTGKSWKYKLEAPGNAIGDFNMIDATSGLDHRARPERGDPGKACRKDSRSPTASRPGRFKRIYKIEMAEANAGGREEDRVHRSHGNRRSEQVAPGRQAAGSACPFNTIENVDLVDADRIIVGDDNNLPFSCGPRARTRRTTTRS